MLVIEMRGDRCNQIFCYALYLSLKKRGDRRVVIDEKSFYGKKYRRWHKDMLLRKDFSIDFDSLSDFKGLLFRNRPKELIGRVLDFILRRSHMNYYFYYEKEPYDPDIFQLDDRYIVGYWQNEKYFDDPEIKMQLRKDFSHPDHVLMNPQYQKWKKKISDSTSISLHIRRGDYLNEGIIHVYNNICTDYYYAHAIERIIEDFPDATIYIFSNDKEYVINKFSNVDWLFELLGNKINNKFVVVDGNGIRDIDEFYLMQDCDHHILANSTFSWWAAWLDDNPDSLIIAPERWNNLEIQSELHTDRMIIVPAGNNVT